MVLKLKSASVSLFPVTLMMIEIERYRDRGQGKLALRLERH